MSAFMRGRLAGDLGQVGAMVRGVGEHHHHRYSWRWFNVRRYTFFGLVSGSVKLRRYSSFPYRFSKGCENRSGGL